MTSTIIGARRMTQLEDNLQALNLRLEEADFTRLDALTKPALGFPQNMQSFFPAIHNGGTRINGVFAPSTLLQAGEKPY